MGWCLIRRTGSDAQTCRMLLPRTSCWHLLSEPVGWALQRGQPHCIATILRPGCQVRPNKRHDAMAVGNLLHFGCERVHLWSSPPPGAAVQNQQQCESLRHALAMVLEIRDWRENLSGRLVNDNFGYSALLHHSVLPQAWTVVWKDKRHLEPWCVALLASHRVVPLKIWTWAENVMLGSCQFTRGNHDYGHYQPPSFPIKQFVGHDRPAWSPKFSRVF